MFCARQYRYFWNYSFLRATERGLQGNQYWLNSWNQGLDIAIFEEHRGAAVPLFMEFNYVPSPGSVPIREVAVGRNQRARAPMDSSIVTGLQVRPRYSERESFTS